MLPLAVLFYQLSKVGDVHIRAEPVSQAISEMGQVFREDWRAEGITGTTVIVDADNITPEDLKAVMSRAVTASFFRSGLTQILKRTREQRAHLEEVERARLAAALKEGLRKAGTYDLAQKEYRVVNLGALADAAERQIRDNLDRGTFSSAPARNLEGKLPATPYLKRVAALLGAPALAVLLPGDRVVYSTEPTAMQRSFPEHGRLFTDYSRDLERVRATVRPGARGVYRIEGSVLHVPTLELISSKNPPAKLVTVCAATGSMGSGLRVSLTFEALDMDDRTIDRSSLDIPVHVTPAITPSLLDSSNVIETPSGISHMVEALSAGETPPGSVNPALRLVDSNEEPLAIFPAPLLEQLAASLHLKLFALLPDSVYELLGKLPATRRLSAADLIRALSETETVDVQVENGWLVVTPTLPLEAAREHVDRRSLSEMLKAVRRDQDVPLDALAVFFIANPLASETLSLPKLLSQLKGGRRAAIAAEPGAHWLRFYGAMKSAFGVAEGWNTRFSQLQPEGRMLLTRATYAGRLTSTTGSGFGQCEPTQLFPDGIPPNGFVLWTLQRETTLTFSSPGEDDCSLKLPQVAALLKDANASVACPPGWRLRIRTGNFTTVRPRTSSSGWMQISHTKATRKQITILTEGEDGPASTSISALPRDIQKELNSGM